VHDDRTPVIVGVGQCTDRSDDLAAKREPIALMEAAARLALEDTRTRGLVGRIDSVRVVNMISGAGYADPGGALAARLGLGSGERLYTAIGGNAPQWLVNRTADDLAEGRARVALLAGAEALATLRMAARRGVTLDWMRGRHTPAMIGDARMGSHPDEWRHGAQRPAEIYPLFEIALRAHEHRTPEAHRQHIATLAASFAHVAAGNPHAWIRDGKSARQIGTVTHDNRMVAFPYPKFMTSVIDVDQAAAVVMTTVAEARRIGIPPDRMVYLHGAGDAHDIWHVKDRVDYHSSPGMALAFEEALTQAGIPPTAIDVVDLYSCFPVAPRFAARILGWPSDGSRPLTVTGGLPYFGGPGNNYAMHAIVSLAERLRAAPGTLGLVSALGWYMTKHAVGIYGTIAPARPWQRPDRARQHASIEALPRPAYVASAAGAARIETYTVLHDRDGAPYEAIIVARLADGTRTLANTDPDPDIFRLLEQSEFVGAAGVVSPRSDGRNLFRLSGAERERGAWQN